MAAPDGVTYSTWPSMPTSRKGVSRQMHRASLTIEATAFTPARSVHRPAGRATGTSVRSPCHARARVAPVARPVLARYTLDVPSSGGELERRNRGDAGRGGA